MAKHIYGIDFGTGNFKIYNAVTNKLINEKSIIATKNDELISCGQDAFEMYEKAPSNIHVTFPIRCGVIADMANMTKLYEGFFEKVNSPKRKRGGVFCIAIPTDISEVEKRAFYDLIADSKIKAKDIALIDKPIADAVGIGLRMNSTEGNMIVNIGADTTEISIVSEGGIVLSRIIKTGGNRLDEVIQQMIKKKYNILVGLKTAETIKLALANAIPTEEENLSSMKVFGRNVITGLPAEKTISADIINDIIFTTLCSIIDGINSMIERTPPNIASDINENGIYLTGGSSEIPNLSELISIKTGIAVNTVPNPELTVIHGVSKVLNNPEYKDLLYIPAEDEY